MTGSAECNALSKAPTVHPRWFHSCGGALISAKLPQAGLLQSFLLLAQEAKTCVVHDWGTGNSIAACERGRLGTCLMLSFSNGGHSQVAAGQNQTAAQMGWTSKHLSRFSWLDASVDTETSTLLAKGILSTPPVTSSIFNSIVRYCGTGTLNGGRKCLLGTPSVLTLITKENRTLRWLWHATVALTAAGRR